MKRIISLVLCFVLILSFQYHNASAENKTILVSSIVANQNDGTVTLEGSLQGYVYSPWRNTTTVGITVLERTATPNSATEDNSQIFHVDEISVDKKSGKFTYSFYHKSKSASDNCTILLNADGYTGAQLSYNIFNKDAQGQLIGTHNVACVNSPLYYVGEDCIEAEDIVYRSGDSIFIPFEIAAGLFGGQYDKESAQLTIGNNFFTGLYVSCDELIEAGITVNVSLDLGVVYTGSKVSEVEINSLIPLFGIHVSTDGDDNALGTALEPVASIKRALELYHIVQENRYIFVHEGVYMESVLIDSAYKDLKVRAIGDVQVTATTIDISAESFGRVTDQKALELLPEKVLGKVVCASVPGCNTASARYKVFADGIEQTMARYPNGGGFEVADGSLAAQGNETFETVYYSNKEKLDTWAKDPDAKAVLYRESGYYVTYSKVIETLPDAGEMKLAWTSGGKPNQVPGRRFRIYNTLCELDIPGEWYIDYVNERIYYYPKDDFETISIVTGSETLLSINDTKNITIEDIKFRGTRGTGVTINNAEEIKLLDCVVQNTGSSGISATKLVRSHISGCVISETEGKGMLVNYEDFKPTRADPNLIVQDNIVENCVIHHVGLFDPIAGAVYFGGTGNTFRHNTIHDTPHMAIWFSGNDNLIEYNDIYNPLKYCDDAGVIYGNPEMKGFGTVIQYNRIHNFESLNPHTGEIYLIYLDANTSGITMRGNLIDLSNYKGASAMGLIGGGRNNVSEGNVFIGGSVSKVLGYFMSNRYCETGGLHASLLSSCSFYTFIKGLTDAQREKWFTKYPALEEEYGYYVEYKKGEAGTDPKGTQIGVARDCYVKDNIFVNEYMFPADDTRTYEAKLAAVCGAAQSGTSICYDLEKSTGNQFLAEFDTTGLEAMKAGAENAYTEENKFEIMYPQNNSKIESGKVRFVWQSKGNHLKNVVTVTDKTTGETIHSATTIENFDETVLPPGEYTLRVTNLFVDSNISDSYNVSFTCIGDESKMITSLDLSENGLIYAKGDSGKIKVLVFDYGGIRTDITGNDGVIYKSSDSTVVTITENGDYNFVGEGCAVVTVEYNGTANSMLMYCTEGEVYNNLNRENCANKDLIDDPEGEGKAIKVVSDPYFAVGGKYKTYSMGMWVYDSLENTPRFGVKCSTSPTYPKIGHVVYYGLESKTDANYHLRHHHDEPIETPVNLQLPRKKGWHQIFMTVETDTNAGLSYVQIYFDGKLVVKMVTKNIIDAKYLQQSADTPIKQRFVSEYTPAKFALVSNNIESGEEIEPNENITIAFNKTIDLENTSVSEVYFTDSNGNRIDATTRVKDAYFYVKPSVPFTAGETYEFNLKGSFVNVASPLSAATSLKIDIAAKNFKVRDAIKTFETSYDVSNADGKVIMTVNVQSLLKEGQQSVLLLTAVKDKNGKLLKVTAKKLTIEPLGEVTEQVITDDINFAEAYIWDKMTNLLPLNKKITTKKEKE